MFELLLGHMVGDYLLQNNWMALNKHKSTLIGWATCTTHCSLYTVAVCVFTGGWLTHWPWVVFASHLLIDKFSLGEVYLRLVGGRSVTHYLQHPNNVEWGPMAEVQAGFTAFVYAVVDNTLHLLVMYVGYKLTM